ncbi:antiviral innate immune response receptor RIG-I [Pseudophryne corroboree]|uniref:antiviral innate immune response receptor RIG-I n=1 Tax=Pseudophryne corroboree TaxID=495146 RepID=UPI003081471C
MSAEVKKSLRVFNDYIVTILKPSYVMGHMTHWMAQSITEKIVAEEKNGATAAAQMFMEKLLELEDEGWFQGFIDALKATGYIGLSEAVEKANFESIERLQESKNMLKVINSTVKNNIKPEELLTHLGSCLLDREIEEITQETRLKGSTAGAEKLIECLYRSDKTEWPKVFTLALEQVNCSQVLEIWKPEGDYRKKHESVEETETEGASVFEMIQYSDEAEPENKCLSAPAVLDYENATKSVTMTSSVPKSVRNMELRKYQIELAQPAYSGKNAIICAPTGSGKTLVALSICKHHLKSIPKGQKGKVVFMATKVPVYEQQKAAFCQYFEDTEYSIIGISGEESDLPVGLVIENNDIIILTPQILVNCLNSGSVPSLSIFTMMIFDECHNTIGNHPYNVLMFAYLDLKLSSPSPKLPQIIGLTASVGTGKSQRKVEVVEYIHKLCASLDVKVISTVKENVEELQKFICKPEKFILETKRRERDPYTNIMSEIMAEIEQMAKSVYPPIVNMSNMQNRTFGSQHYEHWIIDVQKKCRTLQLENKVEESRICSALFTYTEHLRKFNDSLMINEDARTKDALYYLENFFTDIKNGTFSDIERELAKKFDDNLPLLVKIAEDNENPKLEELEFILGEFYHSTPETRTLLFVKTRALVAALKKWIEESKALSFLKPEMLIGRNKRQENTGMTFQSQKGALETFKNSGESKLLIATSVADEGIDIPACNLVLLYEYVGNVTKMIQVRGRGRAKDSKCYLITSKKEQAEKERYNLLREQLMDEAVAQLQKEHTDDFLQWNLQLQRNEKRLRDITKQYKGRELTEENKKLLCGRCKTFACNTEDIRIIQVSHHTVITRDFKDRFNTKPHSKPHAFMGYKKLYKIFCKCGEDWGVSGNYLTFSNIPLIKIEKFVVQNADGTQKYYRKWVEVDFKMKEFKQEEIQESFSANAE